MGNKWSHNLVVLGDEKELRRNDGLQKSRANNRSAALTRLRITYLTPMRYFFKRRIASTQSSRVPKAVKRI